MGEEGRDASTQINVKAGILNENMTEKTHMVLVITECVVFSEIPPPQKCS